MGLLKMNKFELICLIVVWLRMKGICVFAQSLMKSAIRSHKILRSNCIAARWVCAVDCIFLQKILCTVLHSFAHSIWSEIQRILKFLKSLTLDEMMKYLHVSSESSEASEHLKFYLKLFICVHILLNIWYCRKWPCYIEHSIFLVTGDQDIVLHIFMTSMNKKNIENRCDLKNSYVLIHIKSQMRKW